MPTKRGRRVRVRRDLAPEELEWLTGEPQEGASKLWSFRWLPEQVERCRGLLKTHAHLIPRGRRAKLEEELRRHSPRAPSGLASFR